jgi:hypothetical protein
MIGLHFAYSLPKHTRYFAFAFAFAAFDICDCVGSLEIVAHSLVVRGFDFADLLFVGWVVRWLGCFVKQ